MDANVKENSSWPEDRPFSGAGFARMDSQISCVLTRFRLRSVWSLIPFYLAFRRVRRASKEIEGLLKAEFLVENLTTCYTFSLWKDDSAIVDFSTRVGVHGDVARPAFGLTRRNLDRPEIWSAQFRLWAVSSYNLNWNGLNLQNVLTKQQWQKRQEVARGDVQAREDQRA
jgi:hypothetical protein